MNAGGRLAVAGACIVTLSIVLVWALYHPAPLPGPLARHTRPTATITAAAAAEPSLWVLAIGVSHYADRGLDLRYAEADARAIAGAFDTQVGGPVYRDVHTLTLSNSDVTRESVLNAMEGFLGQAQPEDVVVIFLAGHGVQDRASDSYYFLPYAANPNNLLTAALRMTDFDDMVRSLRRNVRAVVLVLDTCHAGGLNLASANLAAADDLATRMSVGEGFFLLAAAKPGEDSKELPDLGHGAFTFALLEGLGGAADDDGDGLLTASDLFGYVARRVPKLTDGAQHPYHKLEGTDLVLAAALGPPGAPSTTRAIPSFTLPSVALTPVINTIGVTEFRSLRTDPDHDWIGKAVRVALNTELSKVKALRVYSPELIDRAVTPPRADFLNAARRLGIRKLVTGSFHVVGNTVRIDAEIVDAGSGVQEASDSVQGPLDEFFELQKALVLKMLRRLRVEISPQEGESIQTRSNTSVDAYRLLLESEGLVDDSAATPTSQAPAVPSPQSLWEGGVRWLAALAVRPAFAADTDPQVLADVRQVLDTYRLALEHKDLDRLATLYANFSPRQAEALRAYLDNATDLRIEFADVSVEPRPEGVAVSYTRRDRFVDRVTSRPQQLEVRLTKLLVREQGEWKFTGR